MSAGQQNIAPNSVRGSVAARFVTIMCLTFLALATWGAGPAGATSPLDTDASGVFEEYCVWAERVVEFLSQRIVDGPGADFTVFEPGLVEFGAVAVSADGSVYHALGDTTGSATSFDIAPAGLSDIRYVRITDNGDGSRAGLSTSGFDLEAIGGGRCATQACGFGGAVENVHMGADLVSRRDAANALGPPDGIFVSLGQGGEIAVEMWPADELPELYPAGSLLVYEFLTTEGVAVEVSADGVVFTRLGDIEGPGTVVELNSIQSIQ